MRSQKLIRNSSNLYQFSTTKGIQDELLWCMLFADVIVLVDETREGVNEKLE